jgi:hypothetical protein
MAALCIVPPQIVARAIGQVVVGPVVVGIERKTRDSGGVMPPIGLTLLDEKISDCLEGCQYYAKN